MWSSVPHIVPPRGEYVQVQFRHSEEPGTLTQGGALNTLTQGGALFSLAMVPLVGNPTQNSRVARPNKLQPPASGFPTFPSFGFDSQLN
jgi:hypothetical protein